MPPLPCYEGLLVFVGQEESLLNESQNGFYCNASNMSDSVASYISALYGLWFSFDIKNLEVGDFVSGKNYMELFGNADFAGLC